jgi:hypothetical protein
MAHLRQMNEKSTHRCYQLEFVPRVFFPTLNMTALAR